MKIDLTKEEWEFIHKLFKHSEALNMPSLQIKDIKKCKSILKKLGIEWVDDHCSKCKNETVACVCLGDEND